MIQGKEANVSAEFTGVLFEDDCKAVVEGGNEIKTGTYTATIVGMIGEQSDNYVLHGEDTDYQIEYQIVKKEETKESNRFEGNIDRYCRKETNRNFSVRKTGENSKDRRQHQLHLDSDDCRINRSDRWNDLCY